MEIIPETEESFVSGYADDHVLINSFHPGYTEIFSTLASHIACIQDWMDKYKLKMNSRKPEFIEFGSNINYKIYFEKPQSS